MKQHFKFVVLTILIEHEFYFNNRVFTLSNPWFRARLLQFHLVGHLQAIISLYVLGLLGKQ